MQPQTPPVHTSPFVSLILVSWKNSPHLMNCLEKLTLQTYKNFEVIIIENGPDDGFLSTLDVTTLHFEVTLRRLPSNLGFAAANNIGAHLARGKWIALLNADAYPEADWLEKLLSAAEQSPGYSAFSSRQIQFHAPTRLDGAGDAYHLSGLAWRNGYNLPAAENGLERREIFSPCAAAALYSRADFLKVGGFDEDYFSYFEDVDLGFRLRLNGAKCLYVPAAIVHHVGSASTGKRSEFSVYYGYRNLIWTFFKDMPSPWVWVLLPLHAATILFFALYITLRGQGGAIGRAILDALRGLPKVLVKRNTIQRSRLAKSRDLFQVMSTGLLEPYTEFMRRTRAQ